MTTNKIRPIHPGEILREEYLEPLGLSANALALALRVPATRVGDILHERVFPQIPRSGWLAISTPMHRVG